MIRQVGHFAFASGSIPFFLYARSSCNSETWLWRRLRSRSSPCLRIMAERNDMTCIVLPRPISSPRSPPRPWYMNYSDIRKRKWTWCMIAHHFDTDSRKIEPHLSGILADTYWWQQVPLCVVHDLTLKLQDIVDLVPNGNQDADSIAGVTRMSYKWEDWIRTLTLSAISSDSDSDSVAESRSAAGGDQYYGLAMHE